MTEEDNRKFKELQEEEDELWQKLDDHLSKSDTKLVSRLIEVNIELENLCEQ